MATKTYSELTRKLIDQALNGLSEDRQTQFYVAWNQMRREILEEARRAVAESFAHEIERRTVGTVPGTEQPRWVCGTIYGVCGKSRETIPASNSITSASLEPLTNCRDQTSVTSIDAV